MTTLDLFVPGIPAPQGSKKAFVVKGRAVVVDDNKSPLRAWRSAIREDIARWIHDQPGTWTPLDAPIAADVTFTLARPASLPKRVLHPAKLPDLDKLLRAAFDAITESGWWRDDSRVVTLTASKRYGDRLGAHLRLTVVTTAPATELPTPREDVLL